MLEYQGSGNNAFTLEACRLQVFTKQALFFTSPADTRGSLWLLHVEIRNRTVLGENEHVN